MSVAGDWKVGGYATKAWNEQKRCWSYELTAEGRKLFDERVAADLNPAGLVRQHHPSLYRVAKRRLGEAAVRAAGWVGLWRAVLSFDGRHSFNAWAKKWARAELQDQLAEATRQEGFSLVDSDEPEAYEVSAATAAAHAVNRPAWVSPQPEVALDQAERREVLRAGMKKLPPAQRDVLSCWLEGYTVPETAREMKASQQVTRNRLQGGIRRLAAAPTMQEYFLDA